MPLKMAGVGRGGGGREAGGTSVPCEQNRGALGGGVSKAPVSINSSPRSELSGVALEKQSQKKAGKRNGSGLQ